MNAVIKQGEARRMSALESMATRLNVTTQTLQRTLMNTVFQKCTEAEFIALVIVSNAYDLNPILREIYAFPKKGGGIQAIVGYDGWIKIANNHPQFDGIEFVHIEDGNGNLKAVEGVLYRKDRNHPTKKMVYLKEFKRNTEPWNNSPNHMLDVRCFCQTVRLGLGIPLGVEGIDNVETAQNVQTLTPTVLPSHEELAARLPDQRGTEAGVPFDAETGELEPVGFTEVDEETARQLDAQTLEGGRADHEHGDQHDGTDSAPAYAVWLETTHERIDAAISNAALRAIGEEIAEHADMLPEEVKDELRLHIDGRKAEILKGK